MARFDLLPASAYQPRDDDARRRAEAAEAGLAQQIDDMLDQISDGLDVAAIVALLLAGRYTEVWELIPFDRIDELTQPVDDRLMDLFDDTAASVDLPAEFGAAGAFNPLDPGVVAAQQAASDALTATISDAMGANLGTIISNGVVAGSPAEQIAQDIVQGITLSPRGAAAVANFRRLLLTGDRQALQRALRDRRFDATVQRWIAGEYPDPQAVNAMVQRYAERMQDWRARSIASYKAMEAANNGRRAAWQQFSDRKGLPAGAVRRFWTTAGDERVCPICMGVPFLNPNGVALGEKYATSEGELAGPPAHGECRCTEQFRVVTGRSNFSNAISYADL